MGESWAHQTQHPLYHQMHVTWVRRTWGASAQNYGSVSARLEGGRSAEQPRHSAALGTQSESVHPTAGMLQASLGFPCGSGCSHLVRGEGPGETLQLKIPLVICLIFHLDCTLTCMCSLAEKAWLCCGSASNSAACLIQIRNFGCCVLIPLLF